jgi:hypothetical protein
VCVVDNSTNVNEILDQSMLAGYCNDGHFSVVRPECNIGYFPALDAGLQSLTPAMYDYYLMGNNDVVCDSDWKQTLHERNALFSEKYVICPSIVTLDGVHQNPMIKDAYSFVYLLKLMVYNLSYGLSFFILNVLRKLSVHNRRILKSEHLQEGEIGIGFGAFYLLTRRFFDEGLRLPTNSFLMGEEQFLYQVLKRHERPFYFVPDLKLIHEEHSSVNKIPRREIWRYNSRAFWKYIWFIPKKLI